MPIHRNDRRIETVPSGRSVAKAAIADLGGEAMHSDDNVKRVRQLLKKGCAHRKIAAQLDVSRGFVCHVATGRRKLQAWAGKKRSVLTGKMKRYAK